MRRIVVLLILPVLVMILLTSCYDASEVDDLSFVLTIGIDKGVTDKVRLTLQFPTMQGQTGGSSGSSGGGSSDGKSGYDTITMDAPSFFTGINMMNSAMPRRLSFEHAKFIVFSEEIARNGDVSEYLAALVRYRQIRRTCHVIVSKGSTMDFVDSNESYIGETLSKTMEEMVTEADNTGLFTHGTLNDLYDGIKSTYRQPIAILGAVNNFKNLKHDGSKESSDFKNGGEYYAGQLPRLGGNKIELLGSAVFDGDTMVGELNGEETRLMLMVTGKFQRGFFTIQDPKEKKYVVPLDIRQKKKPDIKVKIENDKSIIQIKLYLEGEILAIQSRINYESGELMPILEKAFEQQIKNEMDDLMKKCKGLKTDVFGFGDVVVMQFATIPEWEDYNWKKKFENTEVTTEVEFKILRTGTMLKSSPNISTEGKE